MAKLLLGVTDSLLLAGLLYLGSGMGLGIIGLGVPDLHHRHEHA